MTNLEFYKKYIDRKIEWHIQHHSNLSMNSNQCTALKFVLRDIKTPYRACSKRACRTCLQDSLDWLLEEHKEPIKLKQWEYDLLSVQRLPKEANRFEVFKTYMDMKAKGHFEGVTDISMTVQDILDNCEVVE